MARLTARERREAYLREYSYQKKTGKPFFPQVILHDIIVNLFFVLLIVGAGDRLVRDGGRHAERHPRPARTRTRPTPRSRSTTRGRTGTTSSSSSCCGSSTTRTCCCSATIIIPTIWMGILIGMPFIDRTRERRVSRRPIAIGFAGGMAVLLLTLTWKGSSAPNIGGEATATGPGVAFVKAQSCGSCHTLKAMGWGGNIGPNLDSAKPNYALVVERVTKGKAPMPSFKGTLTDAQIKCVATVVASARQGRGQPPSSQAVACKGL